MFQLGNKSNNRPKFESKAVFRLRIFKSEFSDNLIGVPRSHVFVKQLDLTQK
jgi:hypothetical protein